MRPFSLDQAKAGKPVCTRTGAMVELLKFNLKSRDGELAGIITHELGVQRATQWYLNGTYKSAGVSDNDLFMASEKREGWVNVCRAESGHYLPSHKYIFDSEERAKDAITADTVATVKIEWEE